MHLSAAPSPLVAEEILQENKIEKLPVVDKQNKLIGLITYRDIIKVKEHPISCKDHLGRLRVAAAVGVTHDTIERVAALVKAGVDAVVIDTAHGHSRGVVEKLKEVKAGVKYGVLLPSSDSVLESELLKINQQFIEIEANKNAYSRAKEYNNVKMYYNSCLKPCGLKVYQNALKED